MSTPLCVIFQICVPSSVVAIGVTVDIGLGQLDALEDLAGRVHERVQDQVLLHAGLSVGRFQAQDAAHAAIVLVEGLAHLVLDRLGLERHGERLHASQGVEGQGVVEDLHQASHAGRCSGRWCRRPSCRRPARR